LQCDVAAAIVQSGDYLLELDTGFLQDAFTFDDATKGVLDNTQFVLDGTTQFADITDFTTDVQYNRGRKKTDYQFGAGTMSFTMRDETGILGPYDTSSPYYDPANNQPGLAPMRRIRLSRNSVYLFVGVVTSYYYQFAMAGPNTVNVQCADDFYLLAQTNLDQLNVTAQLPGQRIATVLALPEVDYTGTTSLATGTVNLGHDSHYTVPAGTNTLQYLTQINQAEQGRLFMSADGVLTTQNRIGNTLSSPTISFGDDGILAKYVDIEVEFDADNVVNRSVVTGLDGTTTTDSDPTSIAEYFTQNVSITNSLLHQAGEIDDLAAYLLEPDPEPRFTSVTAFFANLTDAQRTAAAGADIGDTISIEKEIPGLGSPVAAEYSIEGIMGKINFNRGHTITYYTAPTTIVYELILNNSVFGTIDTTNVLG
jgi:hypothetical protein